MLAPARSRCSTPKGSRRGRAGARWGRGTGTEGGPTVADVVLAEGSPFGRGAASEDELLSLVASVEKSSEHPLADAIVTYARSRSLALLDAEGFEARTGRGAVGTVDGTR